MGYYEKHNCSSDTTFIIAAGAAGEIGYSAVDFWAADDCYYFVCKSNLLSRYLYYELLNKQNYLLSKVRKASIPRLARAAIDELKVPIPPLSVQSEIVRILDRFTELVTKLETKLNEEIVARKKQYAYYLDLIFAVDDNTKFEKMELYFPFIRNGFVGTVTPFFSDCEHGVRYLEGTNIHNGVISDNEIIYVTKEFHEKHRRTELKADDILMVQSGHVGECAVVGEKYAGANCHALIVMSNGGDYNSKFAMYYFNSSEGKRKLKAITTGETVKHILASKMKSYTIPVLPLEKQNDIVNILDRLDMLYSNTINELLVEVKARRKQYEYYRDRLLTFKERHHEPV